MKINSLGKSILLAAVALTMVASVSMIPATASAKGKKSAKASGGKLPGPAGCGLGYLLLGGHDMQVIAATTNATSYSQLFGITTGTSGCDAGAHDAAMLDYIQSNKEVVQTELARGQGESLEALANITGCKDHAVFATGLKDHYQEIFPSKDPSAASITDSIKRVIEENPQLASTCEVLS